MSDHRGFGYISGVIESKMDCTLDEEGGGRFWRCLDCPYVSKKKNNVSRHVARHHVLELEFPCPLCPLDFPSDANLKRHLKSAHGGI